MPKHKYLFLSGTLIILLFVESSARRPILGPLASDIFIAFIALAVFLVVFERRREQRIAFAAAAAALAFSAFQYVTDSPELKTVHAVVHHCLMAAFLGFAVAVILRNIFAGTAIRVDEVLGAFCGYVLAAGAWANLYAMIDLVAPDSFSIAADLKAVTDAHGRTATFNYFSVVTLTTMGYGDITPLRSPATTLAMLEAIFGQFYIAVVVAQLVGLRLAQAITSNGPSAR